MEVRVAELRDALKLLAPVVPRKPTLPVISNVLLKDGKVVGTDLETMVMLDVAGIDGECLLPQREALKLLKYVPGYDRLNIERSDGTVSLSWSDGNARFGVSTKDEYPDVRAIAPQSEGEIPDGDTFVSTLRAMLTYRARDEARPVLTGVTVNFGDTMEICAADGFRLARQVLPIPYPAEARAIIPAGSISLLCSLWDKMPPPPPAADDFISQILSKRPLHISLSDQRLVIRFGKITLMSNLIQGTAPNYADLVPQDPPIKVSLWAGELERCVNRVRTVNPEAAVRLVWFDDRMYVSAKSDAGEVTAEMEAKTADVGKIGVAGKYLSEYLTGKQGVVTIAITDGQSPLLLHYANSPQVVIMPMFVDWDNKPKTEAPEDTEETEEQEIPDEAADALDSIDEDMEGQEETPEEEVQAVTASESRPKKRRRRK